MKGLASNPYAKELRRALFYQDSVHQFESKAHFDNCDFDGASTYVDALLGEADGHVLSAQAAKAKKDPAAMAAAGEKAFFATWRSTRRKLDSLAR